MAVKAVRLDPDEIAERATKAVQARFADGRISGIEQLVGGTSSLTYAADLDVDGEKRRVVVKAAPPGLEPVRNRDVLRQARILDLLCDVPDVAVPEVLGTDAGAPVDVPPLFVMSLVQGESYEPQLTAEATGATPKEIEKRAFSAARMAAALHAVPTDHPRLEGERVTGLEAEVGRWTKAFGSVEDDLRGGAVEVNDLLMTSIPSSVGTSILHGDWRLGNMQCNGASIDAVIDWEIWSIGDPRLDLAWFLLLVSPGHPSAAREWERTALPTPEMLVEAYEDAAGHNVTDLDWFAALVRYKQAAASALIIKNNRKLPQPGVDIDHMLAGLPRLLDAARALVSRRRLPKEST